jgi:hypothetical protein
MAQGVPPVLGGLFTITGIRRMNGISFIRLSHKLSVFPEQESLGSGGSDINA